MPWQKLPAGHLCWIQHGTQAVLSWEDPYVGQLVQVFLATPHHGNEASIQSILEDVHGEQSCWVAWPLAPTNIICSEN